MLKENEKENKEVEVNVDSGLEDVKTTLGDNLMNSYIDNILSRYCDTELF